MQRITDKSIGKKALAVLLSVSMMLTTFLGCSNKGQTATAESANSSVITTAPSTPIATQEIVDAINQEILAGNDSFVTPQPESIKNTQNTADFVKDLLEGEFALKYDVFDATVYLDNGMILEGIGYSDYASYWESDDGSEGFWPAGFIAEAEGEYLNIEDYSEGVLVYNDFYESPDFSFVYAYSVDPFLKHCVYGGQYIKYGVDETGSIIYSTEEYKRGQCDEELGALYSYDEGRYVFDPNVGSYVTITGTSLFQQIDYDSLRNEVNRILSEQDANFVQEEIRTNAYFAQDAVESYLLSLQEETFLGCDVSTLIEEVRNLDPTQCLRFTPEGYIIVPFDEKIPEAPSDLAKWLVGVGCGIAVAGSIVLQVFVPAATPAAGAISGAAIDVFIQVVVDNKSLDNIQWSKVAVSAIAAACLSWLCPLGASQVTTSVGKAGGSVALRKLAGYGFKTISNSLVIGVSNGAFALIDGEDPEHVGNAFLIGAAIGACCTVFVSLLSEGAHAIGNAFTASHPNNWMVKAGNAVGGFIGKHQVHLKNSALEEILSPKTVYQAARAANTEVNAQAIQTANNEKLGGSYNDVKMTSDGTKYEVHEIPSFSASGDEKRGILPSIKMSIEDHRQTASWGNSLDAQAFRKAEAELWAQGRYKEALQLGITDIETKFPGKYDKALEELKTYATFKGWW